MFDNPLDKAKEKAGKAAEEARMAASRSVESVKTAAQNTEEKAQMEGLTLKDDAKNLAKKARLDLK